ncbi:MAG TPA: GH25 family lysozyme [Candidatus Paceibacterota bacterium]
MYLGVDIASVDGNKPVDWAKAKAAGVQYAIFRGTYITWADPTWKTEASRARDAGLLVGAYLFPVMDKSHPSAHDQVAAFCAAVKLTKFDFPPILDVEFPGGIGKTGHTRTELLQWIRDAVAQFTNLLSVWPILYTSARVWDGTDEDSLQAQPTPDLLKCPLWLARYPFKTRIDAITDSRVDALALPPVPKSWGDGNVWMHQYQGDAVHLPGFSATEDLNRFFDLHQGSSGPRVSWLQVKLGIGTDGSFGPDTERAVKSFQALHNLTQDGVVGPRTFAALCWIFP